MGKLAGYPRQNGLAQALRELGRLERGIFTLEYLTDAKLRRAVRVRLNKGEVKNTLAEQISVFRGGEVRDREVTAQLNRACGLNLVIAMIAVWNTTYLTRVVQELRAKGEAAADALLEHISPLGWEHIGFTGDYIWRGDNMPPKGQFRSFDLNGL